MYEVGGEADEIGAKPDIRISSVVLTRRYETSLRAPLHASDGAQHYLGS